jgi:hypothetical protein
MSLSPLEQMRKKIGTQQLVKREDQNSPTDTTIIANKALQQFIDDPNMPRPKAFILNQSPRQPNPDRLKGMTSIDDYNKYKAEHQAWLDNKKQKEDKYVKKLEKSGIMSPRRTSSKSRGRKSLKSNTRRTKSLTKSNTRKNNPPMRRASSFGGMTRKRR